MEVKGMKNLKGPLLIDSLDSPNASNHPIATSQAPDTSRVFIALIMAITLLTGALILYVLIWLNAHAIYSVAATTALWILNYGIVLGIVGSIIVGIFFIFVLALRRAMISLNDGVHVGIFSVLFTRYDRSFERIAERYFDVWNTRMEKSLYSGVSTLTLDQSSQVETSTTSVQTDTEQAAPEIPLGKDKSTLEELSDKGIINRSNRSLFVGFSKDTK